MAICTKCGNIMHDDDAGKHKCDVLAIPTKGTELKPSVQIKEVE